jgi:hypothetical protein
MRNWCKRRYVELRPSMHLILAPFEPMVGHPVTRSVCMASKTSGHKTYQRETLQVVVTGRLHPCSQSFIPFSNNPSRGQLFHKRYRIGHSQVPIASDIGLVRTYSDKAMCFAQTVKQLTSSRWSHQD